ncbi:MAG: PQQ-binding-like beta-propeller repeat protein [Planctomycetales bacterium]|nr:PQQ-binding-like beta-propeller repeat protein [bacterium]UNM08503.1 MAG: PQQ-binding-like beta-propeller repeat protein [Planctomycetales bacterium]
MIFSSNIRTHIRAAGLASAVLLCLLSACGERRQAEDPARRVDSARLAELVQGSKLEGNDSRAWLSAYGGQGDSNYCSAELKMPLARESSWDWQYSAGSFSRWWLSGMTHYDGRLYITAYSQQLACLDVDSGEEIFNRYLMGMQVPAATQNATRSRAARSNGDTILFSGQCMHPSGKLLMLMGLNGEKMIFDVSVDEPQCLWQGFRDRRPIGFLLHDESITFGDEDSVNVLGLDGETSWRGATQSTPVDIVRSEDGMLFARNTARNIWAWDAAGGELRWSMADASDVTAMAVDDANGLLYLCFLDERCDALNQQDGSVAWSYDYSYLLDDAQRERMVQDANERIGLEGQSAFDGALLDNISTVVRPDGIVLAFDYGLMLFIGSDGQLRWERRDLQPVASLRGFANGLLVQNYWYQPELAPQDLFMRVSPLPLGDPPVWQSIAANRERLEQLTADTLALRQMASEEQQEKQREMRQAVRDGEPLQVMYTALEVLDPQDGSRIDGMELPHWVRGGFVPAVDKVVFESSGTASCWYMSFWQGGDRGISAFDWLEPGGES